MTSRRGQRRRTGPAAAEASQRREAGSRRDKVRKGASAPRTGGRPGDSHPSSPTARAQARSAAIVVPCFNEQDRLDPSALLSLAARPRLRLVLVDDGSTDGTAEALAAVAARAPPGSITLLRLQENQGKAEAVRFGMRHALEDGARIVGYADADFSTPPEEVARLVEELDARRVQAVFGCRLNRLGADVRRRLPRHYLGRVYATLASMALHLGVYDTQCGAKFFQDSAALRAALEDPFESRWSFDVELIARLLVGWKDSPGFGRDDFAEIPLRQWREIPGSKMSVREALRAPAELLRIALLVRPRRRRTR